LGGFVLKLDIAGLKSHYRGLSVEHLARLDPLGRDVALLLLMGNRDPNLDPRDSAIWKQWWSQNQNVVWSGILPKRTPMGQLNQANRAYMQVGLDKFIRTRQSREPLFMDTGLLCRLSGMDWALGLEACLDELAKVPPARALHMWKNAFLHAIKHDKPQSSAQMVKWGCDQGWHGELIDPEPLANAWLLWDAARSKIGKKPMAVAFDDELLDQSLSLSHVRSSVEHEKVFWSTLVGDQARTHAANALSAWCSRYPASWDRMHELALNDRSVPNAWLLACQKAHEDGMECDVWKVASRSHTRDPWLRRLGWGEEERLSPLSAWWALQCSMMEEERRVMDGWSPGCDKVSAALRNLGVVEPGSEEEIALGAKSFAFAVSHDKVDPAWFRDNPQWLKDDPIHNSNPIFTSQSTGAVEKWMSCGFSPFTVNSRGETALVSFISGRAARNAKSLSVWLGKKFEDGAIPTTGRCLEGSYIERLALLRNEEVMMSFVKARINPDQPEPAAQETQDLALYCSAPVVHEWCARLESDRKWSKPMNDALWRGLCFRDVSEDYEVRADLIKRYPFSESPQDPLWKFCLASPQQISNGSHDIIAVLGSLDQLGASTMSWSDDIWQDPQVQDTWAELVLQDNSGPCIAPPGAPPQWWADHMNAWLSRMDQDGDSLPRNASQMERWLHCGLPLVPEVVSVLQKHRAMPLDQTTGSKQNPWWEDPSIQAALQHASLSLTTPRSQSRSPTRRF
jgi:hypothetical protein